MWIFCICISNRLPSTLHICAVLFFRFLSICNVIHRTRPKPNTIWTIVNALWLKFMYLFSNAKGKLTNEKFVCCPMRSMNLNRSYFRDSENGERVCFWIYSPHMCILVDWAEIHWQHCPTRFLFPFSYSLAHSPLSLVSFYPFLHWNWANRTKSCPVLVKWMLTMPYRKNCPRKSLSIIGPTVLEVSMIDSVV